MANRGEIAVRIIRAIHELGAEAVAVYSDADRTARHVLLADFAVRLGPAPASLSYLDASLVLAAARDTGAEAVHPGYGFLSENAHFAEVCRSCNIEFIGPSHEAMQKLVLATEDFDDADDNEDDDGKEAARRAEEAPSPPFRVVRLGN